MKLAKFLNSLFIKSGFILIDADSNKYKIGNPKKEKYKEIHLKDPSEVYIFGKHAYQINKCIEHPNKKLFKNIKELFEFVHTKKSTCNILFSPGYPSGDDFKDFNERGEIFNIHAFNK